MSGGTHSLKSTPNDRFLFFMKNQKIILYRIWTNKDTKQNFCAGKGNAHVNKRQLNQNYSNFVHEWRDPQFNTNSERQTFENLFMAILIVLSTFA